MRTYEKTPAELSSPAAHAPKGPVPPASLQRIAVEALIAAAAAVMLAALLSPAALGLGTLAPHPVWLAVAALAARYGGCGLAVGAPVAWGSLAVGALTLRISPGVVVERLSTGADLCACAGVV